MAELMSIFLAMLAGLSTGMVLFLAAVGLTLVFGVLDVLNFAHGSLYMLGAYFTFFIVSAQDGILSIFGGSFWVAVIVSAIAVAIVGAVIERFIIRPIYEQDHIFQLLLTFALVLVLDNGARILYGTSYRSVSVPEVLAFQVQIAGRGFPAYSLFLIVAGGAAAVGMLLLFEKTRIGKIVRASSEDREMADALGINVPAVFTLVFLFGAALAGLAGGLAAPQQSITPSMGEHIIIDAFIIVVIGGMGSFGGAFVGALLIGLTESLAFIVVPRLQPMIPFALMAVIIIIRPAGLFGETKP